MKIVTIFEDQLYAIQYQDEFDNEFDRLLELWSDVTFLFAFAIKNHLKNIPVFVNKILLDVEQVQDFLESLEQYHHPFRFYFEPLQNSEQKKVLAFHKENQSNQLRLSTNLMNPKQKLQTLVSKEKTETLKKNHSRIKNREMLRESQQIAIKVLMKLEELGWAQKDLAREMQVSPQQITKIVSGKENLTIETQIKLQNILKIPILASYYEYQTKEKARI